MISDAGFSEARDICIALVRDSGGSRQVGEVMCSRVPARRRDGLLGRNVIGNEMRKAAEKNPSCLQPVSKVAIGVFFIHILPRAVPNNGSWRTPTYRYQYVANHSSGGSAECFEPSK